MIIEDKKRMMRIMAGRGKDGMHEGVVRTGSGFRSIHEFAKKKRVKYG